MGDEVVTISVACGLGTGERTNILGEDALAAHSSQFMFVRRLTAAGGTSRRAPLFLALYLCSSVVPAAVHSMEGLDAILLGATCRAK